MQRFHVDPKNWQGDRVLLAREEEHHLLDVLRKTPGDEVVIFDGAGREARARLAPSDADSQRVILEIVEVFSRASAGPELILLVALPKGKRMDLVVEKGTELGVSDFWPILTARVVSRPDKRQSAVRRERWQRIAVSASKQCGRSTTPVIHEVTSLVVALDRFKQDALFLFGDLRPGSPSVRDVLGRQPAPVRRVAMLIGPEGDLTSGEYDILREAGATGVNLGPLTLRVETAALYAAAVLGYELRCGKEGAQSGFREILRAAGAGTHAGQV